MKKIVKRLIALLCAMVLIATMIPADMMPTEAADVQEDSYTYKQVISSCDSLDADSNIDTMKTSTVTAEDYTGNDYVQEGTGLFKSEITTSATSNVSLYEFTLDEAVDVRGYKTFRCKLYISDIDVLYSGTAITIALSEGGSANSRAVQFKVPRSSLKEGWNEIERTFATANVIHNNDTNGVYTGAAVNYVRIWQVNNSSITTGSLTTYLDDVCVTNENAGLLLADCDQMKASSTIADGNTTSEPYTEVYGTGNYVYNSNTQASENKSTNSLEKAEYQEGTGSIKAQCYLNGGTGSSYRMMTQIKLSDTNKQDISSYVETGSLHLWLYLSDISKLNANGSFTVELTSSGAADKYEANWTKKISELQTGWNELVFPLSAYSVNKADATDGGQLAPAWTAINYIRIFTTDATDDAWTAGAYMLVDDIRIVEREVFAQTKESGTISPAETTAPTLEGYVFGGYYNAYNPKTGEFSSPLTTEREATPETPVYIRWVPEEVMTVKAQVRRQENSDVKQVITSCDSLDASSNIGTMKTSTVTAENYAGNDYVQEGTGLFKSEITTSATSNVSLYEFTLDETVDVRGYKTFRCKLYISDIDVLYSGTAITIALSEGGSANSRAVQFKVPRSSLKEGWNEIEKTFATANVIHNNETNGVYTGAAVNYVRIWQVNNSSITTGSLTTYLDDVCVVNENAGLLLADCDQMKATSTIADGNSTIEPYTEVYGTGNYVYNSDTQASENKATNSLEEAEYQEGTGSIKAQCFNNNNGNSSYRMMTQIKLSDTNKQDISSYVDTGSLHLWLYLSDISKLNANGSFTVELTSSGAADTYEANWTKKISELQPGWNELIFTLSSYSLHNPNATNGGQLAPDWTAINYIRVFTTDATEDAWKAGAYMLVDDIRVVNSIKVHDCDSTTGINTGTEGVLVDDADVKQGTGAFVYNTNSGSAKNHHKIRFSNGINFSKFKGHNGSLRFWYYIQNPNLLADDEIIVEISSGSSNSTVSEANQRYTVAKKDLVAGWNEIYINLDDPASTATGSVDWTSIQHICIMSASNLSDCVTRLDDISLVPGDAEKMDVRFVSTVESLGYRLVGYEITQSRSNTPLVTETTDVYSTLYALGQNGVEDSVTPKNVSGTDDSVYMHAATVVSIPSRLWDATFTVTPYWKTQSGTTVKGASKTYTMNYLLNQSERLQNLNNVIDIYLIAGQSNAAGSTHIDCDAEGHVHSDTVTLSIDAMSDLQQLDDRYIQGFENVYYSGNRGNDGQTMTLTKADTHGNGYMGPEVGMATVLSTYYTTESGRTAGFIKYAYGGTSLLDKDDEKQPERGNWVSPSYEAYLLKTTGSVLHGEKTGILYDNLMTQVATSLSEYRTAGYEPVIKGMYWMQGEDDRKLETDYRVAFRYFTQDVREDLAELTGDTALLNMPIIIGEISETFGNADTQVRLNKTFIRMQNELAEEIDNCYIAHNGKYQINVIGEDGSSQYAEGVVDGAHWGWKDCLAIGKDVGNIIKEYILGVTE